MSVPNIIRQLKRQNPNLNQSDLNFILELFFKNIVKALKMGKNVELRGFGTFFTKKIKEKYSARNPLTGEIIYIPEKNKIRFKSSKKLNEIINK